MASFKVGEDVLAYHGPLIHAACVKENEARDSPDGRGKIQLYLVHYKDWSDHWDEWVPESRVLKDNEDSRAMMKERMKDFQRAHKRKQKAVEAASGAQAKKQKGGESAADETLCADLRDSLRLPHGMKLKLIEDWERITREKKVVPLPCKPSLADLLEDFQTSKAKRSSHERLYGEVCDGLRAWFNQALPTILLYQYERRQHREIKEQHPKTPPADIYGAEHLLRLFVKLPDVSRLHRL